MSSSLTLGQIFSEPYQNEMVKEEGLTMQIEEAEQVLKLLDLEKMRTHTSTGSIAPLQTY